MAHKPKKTPLNEINARLEELRRTNESMLTVPRQTLAVELAAETLNEEKRTIDVQFYSGANVPRMNFWTGEKYYLAFSTEAKHIRMGRLNSGAPVLNTHSSESLSDVIGVVEKAWLEDGKAKARLRFSERAEVEPLWHDIRSGIIRNVSMGASVHKLKDVTPEESKEKHYLAVDWEPMEISAVPIGADPGAGFLKEDNHQFTECAIELSESRASAQEEKMEDTKPTGNTTAEPVAPVVDLAAVRAEAAKAERLRCDGIRKRIKMANLDESFGTELINNGVSLETAATQILDKLAENYEANPTRSAHVQVTRDADVTRTSGIGNALLHRYQPGVYKLEESGRPYIGMSLLEVAKEILHAHGVPFRGVSKLEVVRLALSTSDFPYILANAASKALKAAYDAEQQTWRPIATQRNFSDFKSRTINQLGDAPNLELVNEGGEFKYGSLPEARETEQLYTYGKILPLTRQAIVNDDLGAFTRIPAMQGAAAARLESDKVWVLITGNPTMGDSVALFHTTHANYTSSGTAISVTSLGVARAMMRNQHGLTNADGTYSYLNVIPRYLAVPPALETVAQQYTLLVNPNIATSVNPFQGTLQVIAEPRLEVADANGWYLFANPSQVPVIEFGYLDGQEGAFLETRQGFDIDGIEMKVRLDFGAQIIDFRGAYYNVGA